MPSCLREGQGVALGNEGKKMFFSEEKNQKTFASPPADGSGIWPVEGRNACDILVIRLGALGDFVLSFPAFAAIRHHHARDRVVLLTTPPFARLAEASPWFDEIRIDTRPSWLNLAGLARLRRQLRGFDFIYDLQTSRRSARYFRLAGRPPWSGIAPGCSHPDRDPDRDRLHSVERQRRQLAVAGVEPAPMDLSWLSGRGPQIDTPYALLVPATSGSHGGAKTWPITRFAAVAKLLAVRGLRPVVVGTAAEARLAADIQAICPETLDLTGQTSILDLAGLSHRASLTIGGDTGPVHLAAMMGSPTIALFSKYSDPVHATPVGNVRLLREERLEDLSLDRVAAVLP
jgi:ADP-heptose:LPS heptosyltransferase